MLILNGESGARSLAFTADGTRLVATSAKRFDVWALPEGSLARTVLRNDDDPWDCSLAVHPSGDFVFGGGHVLAAISLTVGKTICYRRGDDRFRQVITSPDGRVVAATVRGRLHGYLFFVPRGEFDQSWELASAVYNETLGGFISGGDRFVTIDRGQVIVRNTATGEVVSAVKYP